MGNTEVLARMIGSRISCDTYRIQPVDPYPDDYDAAVERNVREQQADARPPMANPLESIDRYDTVLLGKLIWNVRPPLIMSTFLESYDFSGKTIYPFVTNAMSGLAGHSTSTPRPAPKRRSGTVSRSEANRFKPRTTPSRNGCTRSIWFPRRYRMADEKSRAQQFMGDIALSWRS